MCGYFFKPDQHTGDLQAMIDLLMKTGVRVYTLNTPVAVNGYHQFGNSTAGGTPLSVNGQTLPAGTLWIPMNQGMKHWIQALLGENPFIPYDYYYDVVTWSYPLQRGLAGSGFLTTPMSPGIQMTELTSAPQLGSAPTGTFPVYAFNTDSARGLGLAIDLMDKGVNVYRSTAGFTAGGKTFYSGAAMADGASLAASGVNLADLANKRQTPVTGLNSYPAARRQLAKAKIGLYTNATTIPSNPLFPEGPGINGNTRYCPASAGSGSFCEALHALAVKLQIPLTSLIPVTSTDLANNRLATEGFTAFINPGSTHRHHDRHAGDADADRHQPAGVDQRRRQLHRHQRRRCDRGPHDRGHDTEHDVDHGHPHAGLDVRRLLRRDQPGRLGLRPRRLDLPRLLRQPGVRHRDAGRLVGGHVRRHAGREVRLRGQLLRPDRPPGRRRQADRLGSRDPVRVQPVLPLLEGAGRAARAQRRAVPEGRRDRRHRPVGGQSAEPAPTAAEIAPVAAPVAKAELPKPGAKAQAPVKPGSNG